MPGGQPPASDPQPNASPAAGFDHVGRVTLFALLTAGLTLFFVQSPRHHSWRFDSLLEARVILEGWRCDYNANRPHSAHGELTPTEFARQWTAAHQPQAA